ncbi:MAG: hypothetical protein ACLQQ4_13625 [Bacteroidia bacterium]
MNQEIEKISTLLKAGQFVEVGEYTTSKKILFNTFLTAFKITNKGLSIANKVTNKPEFWKSSILCQYLQEFMSSPVKISFLDSYFQKDANFNPAFNRALIAHYFEDFKRFYKIAKCYRYTNFMKNLNELSKIPVSLMLGVFCQKMETILKEELRLEKEEESDNEKLIRIPFDKVLIGIVGFHESMMQNIDIVANKDLQTMYDVAICREAERIINVFRKLTDKSEITCEFNSSDELQAEWDIIRPSHKFETRDEPVLSAEYTGIIGLLNRGLQRQIRMFRIETYLSGFADFPDPLNIESIKQNEEFRRYRYNDYKSTFEEHYFLSSIPKKSRLNTQDRITLMLKICSFYGIPSKLLTTDSHCFDIAKAFSFLGTFSAYKSPLGKEYVPIEDKVLVVNRNEPDNEFKNCFGANEHISLFKKEDLIKGIGKYFSLNPYESKELLGQVSFEMVEDDSFKGFFPNPFIVLNEKVYWLGRLFKNRRWDVILRNKIKMNGLLPDNEKRKIADGIEIIIRALFRSIGYKVPENVSERKFILKNGDSGEMDLIAYRNGELIIAEVKSGTITEETDSVTEKETLRLEGVAAEQLEKYNKYLQESWDNTLSEKFGVRKKYDKLKICSLIITDFFDGDLKIYKDIYPKISLLELFVILKNGKRELFEEAARYSPILNRNNPEYKQKIQNIEWDLWNEKTNFSMEILKDCIENNKVWKDLEAIKIF